MKATAQTVLIWIFLIFVTGSSLYLYIKEQGNSSRLLYDLKAAVEVAKDFRTLEGHQASKLKAQELTISELRRINPQIISAIKNLDIRPRLVTSYTQAAQTFQAEITVPVKDSLIAPVTERAAVEVKVLQYRDKWISINGVLDPDSARIKVAATDTIFTAIYKGDRRRPWLWVLSKRQYTAAATNCSPYISINVIQSGVIKQ